MEPLEPPPMDWGSLKPRTTSGNTLVLLSRVDFTSVWSELQCAVGCPEPWRPQVKVCRRPRGPAHCKSSECICSEWVHIIFASGTQVAPFILTVLYVRRTGTGSVPQKHLPLIMAQLSPRAIFCCDESRFLLLWLRPGGTHSSSFPPKQASNENAEETLIITVVLGSLGSLFFLIVFRKIKEMELLKLGMKVFMNLELLKPPTAVPLPQAFTYGSQVGARLNLPVGLIPTCSTSPGC